jgi:ATP-binding cassette subfamily F protein 3
VRVLYRDVTLTAAPSERIGLVGANGCGKSTLFAAVLGEVSTEGGNIDTPPRERIAHVAQDIDTPEVSALDYVLAGHAPLQRARAELSAALAGNDDDAIALAHAHLAELHEGAIVAEASAVMHGLGFAAGDNDRPVRAFSGGWRNRLALARALLAPAELLLLDEPTNHLDLDSVIWLEAWLRRQQATVLVISHDREFLDRCTATTWFIGDQTIRRYAGGYSKFELAYFEQQRQQDAAARSYARTAAHLQSYVDRFRAQATKARQAQSRLKMLERLQAVEPVRAKREWRFEFPEPVRVPERLLDTENLALGYQRDGAAQNVILRNVKLVVRAGDRIGMLGINGAGKSTLVKAIANDAAGNVQRFDGELRRGQGLAIGYFAQHQLDQLRPDESPLQHLRRIATEINPSVREQDLRDFLGQYRFSGELATAPVGPMSGGEKARCALALIAWTRPNLLLLDEPTNHLDMETREALTVALSTFEGALLLVSHDRHLLGAATDQLWLVHDGTVTTFDGDLDDYATFVLASRRERAATERNGDAAAVDRREQRRAAAEERNRLAAARKPLQTRIAKLDAEIAQLSTELRTLDAQLAAPDFYHSGDADTVAATLKRRGELATRLETLEDRWLDLQTELEAIT